MIAEELFSYAVATRYPDDWREISIDEARIAFNRATLIFDFVSRLIEKRVFHQVNLEFNQNSSGSGILSATEKDTIRKILEQTNGNVAQSARILGIARGTLYKKMEEHGLK